MNPPPYIPRIRSLTFELSNRCNYSPIHRRCPTHAYKEPVILPAAIIRDTIDHFAPWVQNRRFAVLWHTYNEPLIDPPRLTRPDLLMIPAPAALKPDFAPDAATRRWTLYAPGRKSGPTP